MSLTGDWGAILNANRLNGTNNGEYLYRSDQRDEIYGYGGDDFIDGWGGDDLLVGGRGNDFIAGGRGNDVIIGSDPRYWNSGRGEYDDLVGGAGADTFVLGDRYEAYYKGNGYATIEDFNLYEGDKLRLHGSASDYSLDYRGYGSLADTIIRYKGDTIAILDNYTGTIPVDFV